MARLPYNYVMNSVDVIIVLAALAVIGRGFRIGLLRQAAFIGGFFLGLLLGSWLAPLAGSGIQDGMQRTSLAMLMTVGAGLLVGSALEAAAIHFRSLITHHHLRRLESALGAVFGVGAVLISSWLIAAMLYRLPLADTGPAIERSRIVQSLNSALPPAPEIFSRIAHLISPNGFPRVFIDPEPQLNPLGPPANQDVQEAAARAKDSTYKVQGIGCGGISSGSGFVIGDGLVATNAHVIAGVRLPLVQVDGQWRSTTVVWFNPNSDFAILRTNGRLGPVLPLADDAPRGTSGAVMGYPGGGGLTISPAVILSERRAIGRNIYNQGIVSRRIYEVASNVEPGNSGGPLVLADGTAAGVVFAKSLGSSGYGYVLTADEVRSQLIQAAASSRSVSTGPCAVE